MSYEKQSLLVADRFAQIADFNLWEFPTDQSDLIVNPSCLGEELLVAAEVQARELAGKLIDEGFEFGGSCFLNGPPRGALPWVAGMKKELEERGIEVETVFSNSGPFKIDSAAKIENINGSSPDSIVVADGVIGSGWEMIQHIAHVRAKLPVDWEGNIAIAAGVGAEFGLGNILDFLETKIPGVKNVHLALGKIFSEEECVGWKNTGEKDVYFVGVGDMGGRVQGDLSVEDLYKMYDVEPPAGEN